MTGPEHYREAERLLLLADGAYLDDSGDALPREAYADDEEWAAALEQGHEAHQQGVREARLFGAMAQVHATLAQAAAAAAQLTDPYVGDGEHINAWRAAIGEQPTARTEAQA